MEEYLSNVQFPSWSYDSTDYDMHIKKCSQQNSDIIFVHD